MKISVAMAYYNGGAYVEEQLSSILSQLGEDDEVIVYKGNGDHGLVLAGKKKRAYLNDKRDVVQALSGY